ncbi:MAG: hypothetical protein WDO18_10910 [Acidobacteriota bacterium]
MKVFKTAVFRAMNGCGTEETILASFAKRLLGVLFTSIEAND